MERIELSGIPPAPRGVAQIEVTFETDINGLLHVIVEDNATKRSQLTVFNISGQLSKEETERVLKKAETARREEIDAEKRL